MYLHKISPLNQNPIRSMKTLIRTSPFALVIMLFLFSCQPSESTETDVATEAQTVALDSARQEKRPAPSFFIIPQDLVKSRVWLCDDGVSDVFHVKNDCPVFMTCNATKRNVSLPRAIEEHGRYNCTTCSAELAHIFDEEMIRAEYNR